MAGEHIEIEAKFYLRHLADIRLRVLTAGGHLISPRHLERNERYDSSDGRLSASGEVLRLRIAESVVLAHKASLGSPEQRREVEMEALDAASARSFLQALGYHVILVYEKYREVFGFEDGQVMLDELPFGCFVEVEGSSAESLRAASSRLGLDWARRVPSSYAELFEGLRRRMGLPFTNASFADFGSLPPVTAKDLGLLDSLQPV